MLPGPPSPSNSRGFAPLPNMPNQSGSHLHPDEHIVNIPLTPIRTNESASGARKEGQTMDPQMFHTEVVEDMEAGFHRHIGRRRRRANTQTTMDDGQRRVTTAGKIYDKLMNFSVVTRYFIYLVPLSLCFVTVILVCHFVDGAKDAKVGTVPLKWFFVWLEIVWCSLWVSKLFAKVLPVLFQMCVGVISAGVKKYSLVIQNLEVPISLVGWAIASLCSFLPLMTQTKEVKELYDGKVFPWQDRVNKVLISCLISTVVYLVEKVIIQVVSVDYHRRQYESRILANKEALRFLANLYEVSRNLFPEFGDFTEEDYIIRQGMFGAIQGKKKKSGTATPMRQLVGELNRAQDRITSMFGNIAQEVAGNKNIFNGSSAYGIVNAAMQRRSSAEALAKRIWMSIVPEDSIAMTKSDLLDVMGEEHHAQAEACFESLDKDGNGDVSLDEMYHHVNQLFEDRRDTAKSMRDVDNAIGALNNILLFIVFVIVVLVFVITQQSSVGTTLAGFGTVLISLSFVFSITAQEVLGSTIFLFVKHPYDVGDRVDMDGIKYIVLNISLLYTVFKRVETGKMSQWPNNVLNTKQIDNVSRSKNMMEQLLVSVHFDTKHEDIQKLRQEIYYFLLENGRDFIPDMDCVEVTGINNLNQLDLRLYIQHRGNWSNDVQTAMRRNKFFTALPDIFRKIPIYAPGAGDPSLGESSKPMYYVTIPDEQAQENVAKAKREKEAKRWDYELDDGSSAESDASSSSKKKGKKPDFSTRDSDSTAVGLDVNTTGHRRRSSGNGLRPQTSGTEATSMGRRSTDSRRDDLEEIRGLLQYSKSTGRRKPTPQSNNPFTPPMPPPPPRR